MTITINRLPGYGDPIVLDVDTLVGANLSRADLSETDLSGADLSETELYRANLTGANLSEADLTGANLYGADLTGANLYKADLTGANLYRADLRGANLRGAYLRGADLGGADMHRADLYRATLRGAKIYDDTLDVLITRAGRSDGYEFVAFRLTDGSVKIKAGCRWMTPEEYRDHVGIAYPDTDKAKETLDIIEFIERRAGA